MPATQTPNTPAKAPRKARVLRYLSNMEAYQSGLHAIHYYAATTISCRYTVPEHLAIQASNASLREAFQVGLAHTVLEHPLLQVGLVNEDSARPAWVELETVDLNQHVEWIIVKPDQDYDTLLDQTIHRHLDTFFDHLEKKPGWRIVVLQRQDDMHAIDVVLAWNHANFDGTGAKIFHKTLLRHLQHRAGREDEEDALIWAKPCVLKLESVAHRFPPKVTKLAKFPLSFKWTASTTWKELKPAALVKHNSLHANWAPIRETPLKTHSKTFSIKSSELTGLLRACRSHHTTLTGLLTALAVASLAVQTRSDGKLHGTKLDGLTSYTAMDLRRHLAVKPKGYPWIVPDATLGNIVSVYAHEFDAKLFQDMRTAANQPSSSSKEGLLRNLEDIVWSVASRTRQELQERLDSGLKNEILALMGLVYDWRSTHKDVAKKDRSSGLVLTNLGVLDGTRDGNQNWGIDMARFQLSPAVTAAPFHISTISVKGGDLCADVSWQEGVLPDEIGGELASNVESWLNLLAHETA